VNVCTRPIFIKFSGLVDVWEGFINCLFILRSLTGGCRDNAFVSKFAKLAFRKRQKHRNSDFAYVLKQNRRHNIRYKFEYRRFFIYFQCFGFFCFLLVANKISLYCSTLYFNASAVYAVVVGLSVCLTIYRSVRPSVTRWYCVKTVKFTYRMFTCRITETPYDSPQGLSFSATKGLGEIRTG